MNRQRVISWTLMVLYLAALAFLCFHHFSSIPDITKEKFLGFEMDKVVHFCMFFPFPILCYMVGVGKRKLAWKSVWAILAIAIAGCGLAAGTEFIQGLTPYRTPDIHDFVADVLGMSFTMLFISVYSVFINVRHE